MVVVADIFQISTNLKQEFPMTVMFFTSFIQMRN